MLTARSVERNCSWWLLKLVHIICLPVALVAVIASRECLHAPRTSSFPSILTLVPVALWLTMSWIWIPCWFCSYKERYLDDGLDFLDYVMANLKLQLRVLVMGPVVVAVALPAIAIYVALVIPFVPFMLMYDTFRATCGCSFTNPFDCCCRWSRTLRLVVNFARFLTHPQWYGVRSFLDQS